MKLMYVEDEQDIREVAEFALEDEGFDIEFCESGVQAVEKAGDFQPDVVLLDVMMPEMDGPTTLENLRRIPGLLQTPVIFLTAKVQTDEVQKYIDMGAVDVIPKPFDPMLLADQVRDILDKAGS